MKENSISYESDLFKLFPIKEGHKLVSEKLDFEFTFSLGGVEEIISSIEKGDKEGRTSLSNLFPKYIEYRLSKEDFDGLDKAYLFFKEVYEKRKNYFERFEESE